MSDKYILDGHEAVPEPYLMKWGAWLQSADRVVKKTKLPDCEISTVFLGLDHGYDPSKPPLIFETMVFGGKFDQEMERYSTWDEALSGHQTMIEKVKSA